MRARASGSHTRARLSKLRIQSLAHMLVCSWEARVCVRSVRCVLRFLENINCTVTTNWQATLLEIYKNTREKIWDRLGHAHTIIIERIKSQTDADGHESIPAIRGCYCMLVCSAFFCLLSIRRLADKARRSRVHSMQVRHISPHGWLQTRECTGARLTVVRQRRRGYQKTRRI